MDHRRAWTRVVVAAAALALLALASNVTTTSQTEGHADTLLAVRRTVSQLVNAGTVWAGLAVLAGWLVRRPVPAAAAGVVALLTACVVHYATGLLLGVFEPSVWAGNASWFAGAAVVGGPLGLVGALARRPGRWGTAARLVVPVGAVLEPFVTGRFTTFEHELWPQRVADAVSGSVLLAAGAAGLLLVVAGRRRRATTAP